jgi:hypothetical protein
MFTLASRRALPALALVCALAACSGGTGSTGSPLPSAAAQSTIPGPIPAVGIKRLGLDDHIRPAAKSNYIYASNQPGEDVNGWPNPDKNNTGPTCAIGSPYESLGQVLGFGVDPYGYLVIPAQTSAGWTVSVWKPNCGALVWEAAIPAGEQPVDAYSNDAVGGALLAVQATSEGAVNGLLFCTPAGGCDIPFTNPAVTNAYGVALAKNGDCWLQGTNASGYALFFFPHCTGSGELATGTINTNPYGPDAGNGLFIDTEGHLGSIDTHQSLYVYSGCTPACSLVSQSTMYGTPAYGGLDAKGENLVVGRPCSCGTGIDVYSYSPTSGATYSYSITNGVGNDWAAHFAPRNKKT